MDVELEGQTVIEPVEKEVEAEPFVEPVETKTDESVVEEKSSKDLLDEVVAKVSGKANTEQKGKTTPKEGQIIGSESQTQYTPNFKFTANKKEQEIPDYLRSVIKDKASEKQIRELCEKAFGLETVKADRDSLNTKFTETETAHQNLLAGVQSIRSDYQRGDLDSFFQKLKIPEEVVLKYALEKAKYYNLAPEEQRVVDARKNAERTAVSLETQNQDLAGANAQAATRMKQLELDFTFMRPETSALEKSVDSQFGKPGVLRQMVIDHGYNTWVQSKGRVDLTPAQALAQVAERYGLKPVESTEETAQNTVNRNGAGGTQTTVQRKPTNVIPNIQGRSNASPLKTKPRSIDDIRKIAAQM